MSKAIGLLGIAKKAGRLEIGEKSVEAAARGKKARVIFTASDAAENTQRRAQNLAHGTNTMYIALPYTKVEIGRELGKDEVALLSVSDAGIAAALVKKLDGESPDSRG